jgi:hypothetical protein
LSQYRIKKPKNILQSINLYTGNKKNQVFTSSLLLVSVSWPLSTAGIRIGLPREVTSILGRIRFPFSLSFLLVRSEVEGDEENEARADNNNTSKVGKVLSSTLDGVEHPGEICRGKLCVRCEVDEADVDDELDYLEASDPLLAPDTDPTSTLKVVPVHDNMDCQIQRYDSPLNRGMHNQLGVAQDSSRTMVIAVEERQRFLLEEQEYSNEELDVFGQIVRLTYY